MGQRTKTTREPSALRKPRRAVYSSTGLFPVPLEVVFAMPNYVVLAME